MQNVRKIIMLKRKEMKKERNRNFKGKVIQRILAIAVILFIFSFLHPGEKVYKDKINELVKTYSTLDMFSGTILVAKEGKVIYAGACGYANKDHNVPNKLETRFNIGSIGKTITGTAIMQLVQTGKLKLKDTLGKFLPDFPYSEKDTITIHHLLTHTSGLGNYMSHKNYMATALEARRIKAILPLIYDQKPTFQAGHRFQYSNSGMVVLGAIIEKVSGMSYSDYIKKHIFEPIGMHNSGIVYREQVVPNRAVGYIKLPGGNIKNNIFMEPPAFSDGGLYTTVEDLFKFDQALYTETLLSKKYKDMMLTCKVTKRGYAYGWGTGKMYGHRVVGHGGGAPGINASFYRYIDDHITIIVLSNYDSAVRPVFEAIEAIVFDKPYHLPTTVDAKTQL